MSSNTPQSRGFKAGMNMLAPDYAMPEGAVRDATNLDVTNEGVLRTRQGFAATPEVPGVRCHSMFAASGIRLHADGSSLKRTVGASTSVVASVQAAQLICYAALPDGSIAWSDGTKTGRVTKASSGALALQSPGAPVLSEVPSGRLSGGTYQAAITWVSADGSESPPSLPVSVSVADDCGFVASGIPSAAPAGAVAWVLYCSHVNEGVLFEAASAAVGTTSAVIDAPPTGRPLESLFQANMPAGQAMAFAAGRLLVARGNVLYWSEPHRYGVTRPASSFVQLAAPISMIAPTQDGVYVGTLDAKGAGEVVFLAGFDFGNQPYRPVTPYGAYPGTLTDMPHTMQMVWASPQGFVVADNSGQITNISFDKMAFPQASRGGSLIREQNGIRQIITSLEPVGSENPFAVSDYAEAEIIKGASNV